MNKEEITSDILKRGDNEEEKEDEGENERKLRA